MRHSLLTASVLVFAMGCGMGAEEGDSLEASQSEVRSSSFTHTFHNDTLTEYQDHGHCPMSGAHYHYLTNMNGVMHVNVKEDGTSHFNMNLTADIALVPEDPTQDTYVGKVSAAFVQNSNEKNAITVFTNPMQLTNTTDGSTVHLQFQMRFVLTGSGAFLASITEVCN